jgi:poly-beta-1,6-N-acetyl-D-glucosamine biosynthesis protein PgaD
MPDKPTLEDNASLRSTLRNITEVSFTSIMWAIWIHFFIPVISLVLWIVGIPYLYQTLFKEDVLHKLLNLLGWMGWFILITFILLRGWGYYNYYVFGRRNRRRQTAEVTAKELGDFFGIPLSDVRILQQQKEIVWTKIYNDIRSGLKN